MATSITNAREMDTVLPNRVNVNYLDVNREYDQNEQYAQRITKESVNTTSLDLAIVMNSTEAAQAAEVLLYMYWLERNDVSFSLPPTYNNLEPGDVVTINANEGTYQVRLTEITYTQEGRLECKGKYSSAATYTSSASGGDGTAPDQTLAPDGNTELILLDIPCLLDAYNMPGYIAAMTGYSSGWPGGVLYRSDDEGQTWTSLQGFVSPGSEFGYTMGNMGSGRTDIFDTVNSVQVALVQGEFSSETELNVLNGVNWFAYGIEGRWEIIGVKTCLLQSDGTYIFRDFLRGRKGTEWAMGSHAAGDAMVLLDSNSVSFISVNSSSINVSRQYKGVTTSQAMDEVSATTYSYQGVNLECLSPIYLNGNKAPGGTWTITWVRRSRIDNEWRDYVDESLGETAEQYIVEFYDSTYATLKHTSAILTTPTYSYSAAQQTTDFGSIQNTLYCKIYQLSSVVGRGYALTQSISVGQATVLLLHMDVAGLPDAYGKAVTVSGATLSSAQSKFGGNSALFDGINGYVGLATSPDFDFGTGLFTIELQVNYSDSTNGYQCLIGNNPATWAAGGTDLSIDHTPQDNKITFWSQPIDSALALLTSTTALTIGSWYHIALVRDTPTTIKLFVGGILEATKVIAPTATFNFGLNGMRIGGGNFDGSGSYYKGYIDEVRITKGIARYSANFTAPAAAFTD